MKNLLHCTPLSICSWNYRIDGRALQATVARNTFGEQGTIELDGQVLTVDKGSIGSGHWTLSDDGQPLYTAQKVSMMRRAFVIEGPYPAALTAVSVMSRGMQLESDGMHARISPVHAFTRRAQIEGAWPDDQLVVFAFWLSVLMWRRAANSSASSPGSQ